MTESGPGRSTLAITALVLVGLVASALDAQQATQQAQASSTLLKTGIADNVYTDDASDACEKRNADNPFAGMNPLVCHGEMAPTDSRGQCSLAGMQLLKKVGNECYYCLPIEPPIDGIILPIDMGGYAEQQGFRCAVDQADPECMMICTGPATFQPPIGVRLVLSPSPHPTTGPQPNPGFPNPGVPNPTSPTGGPHPPASTPGPCPGTSAQQAADFNNQLLADAQKLLLEAGRISKAATDAMDVTKHNDVGVKVGISSCFGSAFGAAANYLKVAAQQIRLAAAARCAATEETAVVQIASDAAAESETMANQATQTASQLPSTAGAAMGNAAGAAGYMENAAILSQSTQVAVAQGNLPTCAVLACDRLAQLLGRNIPIMRIFESIRPKVVMSISQTGEVTTSGGLTATEVANGLRSVGVNAEVGSGMTNMMNQVRAGQPVIAGVYTSACSSSPLHAVVIEGIETQGEVAGLRIYDPVGWVYWQPIQSFQKYFAGQFVRAL